VLFACNRTLKAISPESPLRVTRSQARWFQTPIWVALPGRVPVADKLQRLCLKSAVESRILWRSPAHEFVRIKATQPVPRMAWWHRRRT
jgi:hypothetical protein